MNWKNLLTVALIAASASVIVSCDDDDDPVSPSPSEPVVNQDSLRNVTLTSINKHYIETTLQPTYEQLAAATRNMIADLEAYAESKSQDDLNRAGDDWKAARQYWEWSEAFLFGAAAGYSIDPHIDTWPFDAAAFTTYMKKFSPATNEDDAALLLETIATGQNLTGFHAVEYLLFREGAVRNGADLTDDEIWFCIAASQDLYLNASKLVSAWDGAMTAEMTALLEEAEWEADANFGEEFVTAGNAGSRWSTPLLATTQIIEGCREIIGEVAEAKIGHAFDGDDTNYIESPHAYNSITDFYDNIVSCKNSLYGLAPTTESYTASYAANSVMEYAVKNHEAEAKAVIEALENALKKIEGMKRPFVIYYQDATAAAAIEALQNLDETLVALSAAIQK